MSFIVTKYIFKDLDIDTQLLVEKLTRKGYLDKKSTVTKLFQGPTQEFQKDFPEYDAPTLISIANILRRIRESGG